ncbi:MAG: copper resistance protein CopC [Nitrososphaeraceae archaeon]
MITRYLRLSSTAFVILSCFLSLNGIHYFKNAYGHPVVIDSYPKQFQSLEESPDKVILFFSEAIVLQYSQISVIDSEGNRVDDGKAEFYNGDPSTIATNIKKDLPEGTYTINTKVLSAVDGHVVDGSVVFSVGEGVSGVGEQAGAKSKSIFELISFDNSLSRVPGYIGQIIIIGAPLVFLWIQKPLSQFIHIRTQMNKVFVDARKNLMKLIIISDMLVIFSVVIMVVFQASSIGGNIIDVFSTEFGEILIIRLIISIILLIVTFIFYNKYKRSYDILNTKVLLLIIILGLAILLTNSLISHSAALKYSLPIFLDYFHGIAASIWIGGLVFLAFILIPKILQVKENDLKFRIISIIIPRFSIIVLPILASIVLTGPTLLWFIENNLSTTFSALYGKILILKLTLAVMMIILGAYHEFITSIKIRHILIKKIGGDVELTSNISLYSSLRRFYMLLRIESVLGIALLFVVSLMTNMVLPSGEFQTSDNNNFAISQETNLIGDQVKSISANNEYLTDIYSNNQKIQVKLEPGALGQNTITVSFIDLNSGQNNADIENATLKLYQIEKKIGPIQLEMQHVSNGVFSTTLPISTLGVWSFEIQGKTFQPNTPNTIATFNIGIEPSLSDLKINLTEYPTSDQSLLLYPIYHEATNSIWVGDTYPGSGRILEFSISDKTYKIHKIEGTNLITLSVFDTIENNILWYVDPTKSIIGKYDVTTNKSDEQHELPYMGIVSGLAIDGEQNLWLSTMQDNSIIKFDSKMKNFTRYEIPTENSRPLGLIFDKKNNYIWFAEALGKLGKIDLKTGYIAEYPNNTTLISEDFSLSEPTALLLDPKTSNIYISDHEGNSIVLFNPIIESFKRYPLPDNDGLAFGMVFDIYKNIWIAEHVSDVLVILDPDSGKTTNIKIPKQGSFVQYLTTDSQGDIWFAEQRGGGLGKATIKFIPSNIQPSRTEYPPTNNNTTNQSNNNAIPMNIKKLEFYKIIGPLMIVVVIASTLLYINSYEKLYSNLNDLGLFQSKFKDQTKNKKR